MCHMYYKFLTSEMLESINKNRPLPEKNPSGGGVILGYYSFGSV